MFPLPQTPPTQTPPGQQSEEDEPDSSSYAGMATALANAIKERRQHISDKSEAGRRGWMGRREGGREDEEGGRVVSCPDPTHSNEEKGLVFFEQFLGLSSEFWEANQNRSM